MATSYERVCLICNVGFNGPAPYLQHLESITHIRKSDITKGKSPVNASISEFANLSAGPSDVHFCKVCSVAVTGIIPYRHHLEGQKHEKKMKMAKIVNSLCNQMENTSINDYESTTGRGKSLHQEVPQERLIITTELVQNRSTEDQQGSLLVKVLQGDDSLQDSLIRSNVSLLHTMEQKSPSMPGHIWCNYCQVNSTGPIPYEQHITSAKHIRTKKMAISNIAGNEVITVSSAHTLSSPSVLYIQKKWAEESSGEVKTIKDITYIAASDPIIWNRKKTN